MAFAKENTEIFPFPLQVGVKPYFWTLVLLMFNITNYTS